MGHGTHLIREFTEAEIIKLRRHARAGLSIESAMEMMGIPDTCRTDNFRKAMRRRYGMEFTGGTRAHNGDVTTIGKEPGWRNRGLYR